MNNVKKINNREPLEEMGVRITFYVESDTVHHCKPVPHRSDLRSRSRASDRRAQLLAYAQDLRRPPPQEGQTKIMWISGIDYGYNGTLQLV
ncbi:hypothetical protein QJS10_CPB19g01821 [Acorus calamus]|uniref:Uncharacterized protein n=1 Tax=Acorus calamus TaxID=4465 RepID=A0AAV9CEF1_ACOCL|nr:hypothetical protein QJS10_CPB19g01821 [Acorus calamus]